MREGLAVLGAEPAFTEVRHVGRPNLGDRERFLDRVAGVLDRGWHTNHGPVVQEFEDAVRERLDVGYAVATGNATAGLSAVAMALDVRGPVVVPSFTFVATAHAHAARGNEVRFADVRATDHTLDPASVLAVADGGVAAVIGVHLWGSGCDVDEVGRDLGVPVVYDAAHAFGCTRGGRPIGGGGAAEVFSFHATKYVGAFEGGMVTTNDGDLAERVRRAINFGFAGYDAVTSLGINGKMPEVCAAMGLTSLEAEASFAAHNLDVWQAYAANLAGLSGLRLHEYDPAEHNAHQYVVVEVSDDAALSRDELVAVLHADGCKARRYFSPGVHRMEPYASLPHAVDTDLTVTERLCRQVMTLPTGTAMDDGSAATVCALIGRALDQSTAVRAALAAELRTA